MEYEQLLQLYGPQGWWPLLDCKGVNPTKSGAIQGYHPGDYSYPKNDKQRFEICVGAILTQNTNWTNVEKALIGLNKINCLEVNNFLKLSEDKLKEIIKPAGYYNQKARKLKEFAEFYIKNKNPTREELLSLWGIGPETADSILLYAYKVPTFVVDTYTKRVFGFKDKKYEEIKEFFESKLKKEYKIYQEYHALIVEHGKRL